MLAALLGFDGPLDLLQEPVAHVVGRDHRLAVLRCSRGAGERVEQLGHVGRHRTVAGEEAEVLVQTRRLRVVVAGPDVHVVARPRTLAAHHEQRLRVCLQAREAVHHVSARLLERARPADVAALVEPGLQLHQTNRLLAVFGRLDQRRHEIGVVGRAVHRHLDCEHVGVGHGLPHEALHGSHERVVRVVHEQVARAHGGEHVSGVVLGVREGWRHHGRPGLEAELAVAVDVV